MVPFEQKTTRVEEETILVEQEMNVLEQKTSQVEQELILVE